MSNTHSQPDLLKEIQALSGDLLPACLLTSSGLTPPGSGLTLAAASVQAYARSSTDLVYINQPAISVTVPNVAGSHWLIAHRDSHSAVAGWTRRAGSHFLTQQAATQPTIPDGAVLCAQLTVAGGNVTVVDTSPALTPPLSRQTADAVAITDGRISLGGHAPTGVLDVQGSVVASDLANVYVSTRVWPVAPSGATDMVGVRIQPATGAAIATANFLGIQIQNPPTTSGNTQALQLSVASGTNRYNVYASGTAPNYFAGNVGVGVSPDTHALRAGGAARIDGALAIGGALGTNVACTLWHNKSAQVGLFLQPTNTDTGSQEVVFANVAGTPVGSITTTATATSYNTSSDVRLKFGVTALTGALEVVTKLRPIRFRWVSTDEEDIGFLAHELMVQVPTAVSGLPDEVHPDGTIKPQQVDHSRLVPLLTAGLKDALALIESLTGRVNALEEALGL